MEAVLKILIIGATVAVSMYFAYLSTKAKAAAQAEHRNPDGDSPGRDEFEALHQQVAELAERVDFAERMLAQRREVERLDQPRE